MPAGESRPCHFLGDGSRDCSNRPSDKAAGDEEAEAYI